MIRLGAEGTGQLELEQQTLAEPARALRKAGDLAGAMALLKGEEEICRSTSNVGGLWEYLKSQGDLLHDSASWSAALKAYREAKRLCRQ
jgi:hypothetical protein